MERYRCKVCGHIYDPEGDPSLELLQEQLEDLPEDWVCPVCGAKKAKFQPVLPGEFSWLSQR